MKKFTKLLGIVLIIALVMSFGTMAFAATYSITIDNALDGETYTAYKIFGVTYSGTNASPGDLPDAPDPDNRHEHTAYSYTITTASKWWSVIIGSATADSTTGKYTAQGLEFTPTSPSGTYIVTATNSFDPAAFAVLLNNNKTGKTAAGSGTGTTTGTDENKKTTATINVSPDEAGYYFVDTSLGSLCSLDTTEPAATIREKNTTTIQDKVVKEDGGSEQTDDYGDKNDADVGQTVEFKSTVEIGAHQSNVVFHDIMQTGKLAFNWDSVTVTGATVSEGDPATDVDKYTIYYAAHGDTASTLPSGDAYNGDTFAIAFDNTWTEGLSTNTTVTITYTAVVTKDAIVGLQTNLAMDAGNDNKSSVTYGDAQRTTWDWTRTYVWGFDVFKYANATNKTYAEKTAYETTAAASSAGYIKNSASDATDATYWVKVIPLENATFQLSKTSGGDAIQFVSAGTNQYRLATAAEIADNKVTKVTSITTDSTGKFTITGLDADTYYLTETAAPAAYNKLAGAITVVLDSNTDDAQGNDGLKQINATIQLKQDGTSVDEIEILNQSGTELPSTGGIGTTIFYVVGSILVIAAGVLLITKKRMGRD